MIRLNVFIQVSAENRAAVLESAKELVAYSLKDNGCIAYDVFEKHGKMQSHCLPMKKQTILWPWCPKSRGWLP